MMIEIICKFPYANQLEERQHYTSFCISINIYIIYHVSVSLFPNNYAGKRSPYLLRKGLGWYTQINPSVAGS